MKTIVLRVLFSLRFVFLLLFLTSVAKHGDAQNIDFGKSYINVTKGLNGGTIELGDTLEIRASFVVRSGTYDSCGYTDAVPAGTTYIPGSIKVLTNEGKVYKAFTDAANDDAGWITAGTVRINLGYNTAAAPATAFRRGRVINTHKPSFYGSTCIMLASFRVRVVVPVGSNISTGGGAMTYKSGAAAIQTFTFPSNIARVYQNFGICSNTVGTNSIGTESNGTFGFGKQKNRTAASANVPVGYTYSSFASNMPNDYFYGLSNNTSTAGAGYSTSNAWPRPDPSATSHRVFGVWDIIGDHTGAVSPTAGNPATDTVLKNNGGYMLVINAAYRIDSAFQQTISSLCPNTYYEISCWMRSICPKCGCDSNGVGASGGVGYIPSAPLDSSGVAPNLTFDIDGVDYYTTGNIKYTGQWIKKGFTFLTGPAQTSFTLKFFNNAPGGGGNDWALDDIAVATCSPNMKYSPSINPTICDSNTLRIYDTVRSFFNNYTFYKWQRSTNGGATWTDVTAASGPSVPTWNGTEWQYVTFYDIPTSKTLVINNGDKYRLVVATTLANLSSVTCNFTDVGNIITLSIINCGFVLDAKLLSFAGQINNNLATLQWTTTGENESIYFDVERSTDGANYSLVSTVNGHNDYVSEKSNYSFTDAQPMSSTTYYRLRMRNTRGQSIFSKTVQLNKTTAGLTFVAVINPFQNALNFDVSSDHSGKLNAELIDQTGKTVRKNQFDVADGVSSLSFNNTDNLPAGFYVLRVQLGDSFIQKKVIKQVK